MILDKYLMYRKEEIDRKRKTSDNSVETNEKMRGSVIHYLVNQFGNRKIKKEDIDIFQTFYNITSGTTEVINGHDIQMINRRHKDATLEVQEYLDMIDSENFLEKLVKAWYTALFFTINDFIIALLPVIQLEYYKSDKLPPNCYLICEILNVVALMDPIINYKSNKNLFYRKLIMFKLYTTLTLIILSNILQFANIPIASTEVKVAQL